MKTTSFRYIIFIGLCFHGTLLLGATKSPVNKTLSNSLVWSKIPAKFNPEVTTFDLGLEGVKKVDLDLFSFQDDVKITYDDTLEATQAKIEIYWVRSKEAEANTWLNTLSAEAQNGTLRIRKSGGGFVSMYACSKKVKNNQLISLAGACYIKIVLKMPKNAQVEIYNVGRLISKQFFVLSDSEVLEKINNGHNLKEIQSLLANYVRSHQNLKQAGTLPLSTIDKIIARVKNEKGTPLILQSLLVSVHANDKEVFLNSIPEQLKKDLYDATFYKDKGLVIQQYLTAFKATKNIFTLKTSQLAGLIDEFSFRDEKLKIFVQLQSYIKDRENLLAFINNVFWVPTENAAAKKAAKIQ